MAVFGTVADEEGSPDDSAVVAFTPVGSGHASTARTDPDGSYRLTLAPGAYVASCASADGDCEPALSDQVDVSGPVDVDFLMTPFDPEPLPRPDPLPNPDPLPHPEPPPVPLDAAEQCRQGGFNVCGQVVMDGQPVSGVVIEFTFGDENQTVTTDGSGSYSAELALPTATAICVEPPDLLDQDYICGATGSDGGPVSVSNDELGQIVDFTLCPSSDQPACLQPGG